MTGEEFLLIAVALVLICVALKFLFDSSERKQTKSEEMRSLLSDLYVIGKIRKFAEADGIKLEVEMKNLKRLEKLMKLKDKDVDDVIEDELKEKITADAEKKLETIQR